MPRLVEWYTPNSVLDEMPEPADRRDPYARRVGMAAEALARLEKERALLPGRLAHADEGGFRAKAARVRARMAAIEGEIAAMRDALEAARRVGDAMKKETER